MDTSGEKLELYLDFSEIEGTQVIDQSGEDRHGNLPDGFIFQVDPVVGGCLSFNGTSDYVELPEKLAIDYSDGFTVEAWVYYLSFNRWSRIIDFSNEAGRDNILFANFEQTNNLILQVYSDSLVGTLQAENVLKIGEWLHLAATISSNGEAILYVDGQQVAKGSVHLPDSVPRNSNYIGRNNWEPDGYFQGKMANVRVYSRVLTGAEIQQDWNADKIVIPPSTHPLNFSLLDDDQQPVLFITDNLKGHNLYLEVVNTSDQAITLVGNQLEGSENRAKAGNCYLELWFRPKTLPTEAEFLKPRQSGQSDWTIHSRLGENGSVSLYLTSTTAPSLKPGEKLFFTLPHMLASGNSSRGTNVRLKYDYYVEKNQLALLQKIRGNRLKRLNIVNQRGKKYIPLHVGFVDSYTVLNDGQSENQLTLRVTNDSRTAIPFGGSDAKFIISFDIQKQHESKEWALLESGQVDSVTVSYEGIVIPRENQGETPEWIINLNNKVLDSGQHIQIELKGIRSSLPSGSTNMYVRYENIPGYWDGQFVIPIEKAPILYRNDNVGIGISQPGAKLHIINQNQKADGNSLILGPTSQSNLRLGYDQDYSWIQSHGLKPLAINQICNNVGIGTTQPQVKLDVNGDIKASGTLYAAGNPLAYENYEIYVRGSATDSVEGDNIHYLKIANVQIPMDGYRGLNTTILNPNGTFKAQAAHDIYDLGADPDMWNQWADWVNANSQDGDVVAVASRDAVLGVPLNGSAETLLRVVGAVRVFDLERVWRNEARRPYALLFIKGRSGAMEVLQPYKGSNAHLKTTYYHLLNNEGAVVRGMIMMWSGNTTGIPSGWALCDGSNGTPNLKDKFLIGAGGKYAVNSAGGEETVTLTVEQMPVHSHGVNDPGHSHVIPHLGSDTTDDDDDSLPVFKREDINTQTSSEKTNISIQSSGGGQAHNNLPPYYALCFIMKL